MDAIFFKRIKYYRADRQLAISPNGVRDMNGRVDLYGERITGLKSYKRWIKKQRKMVVNLQANGVVRHAQLIKPFGKWVSA